jgi:tetratricopeptide (TPR) repeat protein
LKLDRAVLSATANDGRSNRFAEEWSRAAGIIVNTPTASSKNRFQFSTADSPANRIPTYISQYEASLFLRNVMRSKFIYLSLATCVLFSTGCDVESVSSLLGKTSTPLIGSEASATPTTEDEKLRIAKAYARELREINIAIKVNAKDWSAYIDRSYCSASFGQTKRAMADANKSIEIAPRESETYAARSHVWSTMEKHQEALDDINTAINLEVDYSGYYTDRGYYLESLGRYREALADYQYAIELYRDDPLAWNNYASVLSMAPYANLRNGKEAVKAAVMAIKLAGDDDMRSVSLDTLGSAWAEAGNFEKAIKSSEAALKYAHKLDKAPILERIELYKSGKLFRLPAINEEAQSNNDTRSQSNAKTQNSEKSGSNDKSPADTQIEWVNPAFAL